MLKGNSSCSLFRCLPTWPDTVADAKVSTFIMSSPPSDTGMTSTSIMTSLLQLCLLMSPVRTGFSSRTSLIPLIVFAVSSSSTMFSTTVLSKGSDSSKATARSTTLTCVGTSCTFRLLFSLLLSPLSGM